MTDPELLARIEKLERDNRQLKRLGAAACALVGALGLVAAARPLPNVIKAHEFEVVNGAGKARIRLYATPISASVDVLDAQGNTTASMEAFDWLRSSYITAGQDGEDNAVIASGPRFGSYVGVGYAPHYNSAIKGKSGTALRDALKSYSKRLLNGPSVGMGLSPAGTANISIKDSRGFRMELGNTATVDLKTGATQDSSADSIIMFGNDKKHHVIWQAP